MIDAQFAAYEARCTKAAALATEILPHNKQVLFDTLSAASIDVVTIGFDGSGDERPVRSAGRVRCREHRSGDAR